MSEGPNGFHSDQNGDSGPEDVFRNLAGRSTAELDSRRAWQRLARELQPPVDDRATWWPFGRGRTPVFTHTRYAFAAGALAVVLIGAGLVLSGLLDDPTTPAVPSGSSLAAGAQPDSRAATGGTGPSASEAAERGEVEPLLTSEDNDPDQLVLLLPEAERRADDAAGAGGSVGLDGDRSPSDVRIVAESAPIERRGDLADSPPSLASRRLDVRLLRGYTGSAPADALVGETFLGAGGGSAIADVRARLRGTLPFVDYALLGRWQGEAGALTELSEPIEAELAPGYVLRFSVASDGSLNDVTLIGAGQSQGGSLRLEAGKIFVIGFPDIGEQVTSLVVALRLLPAADGDPAATAQR